MPRRGGRLRLDDWSAPAGGGHPHPRALRRPYATVHYADLPELLGVHRRLLPDVDVVQRTKIKTRSQIAAFDLRHTMSRLGLEVVW